tara:strand:+ start:337 stop:759 length:423 start_codon:yes stop_codon:yes gene_type:complete
MSDKDKVSIQWFQTRDEAFRFFLLGKCDQWMPSDNISIVSVLGVFKIVIDGGTLCEDGRRLMQDSDEVVWPTNLIEHIKSLNEASRKHMEEHYGDWVGLLAEDEDHWRAMGITTVPQLNRHFEESLKGNLVGEDLGDELL